MNENTSKILKKGVDFTGISVAFYCHDGSGNFVFHKRSPMARDHHYKWDSGGGGIKFGEDIEDALMRELKEEYGCTGKIEEQLPASSNVWNDEGGLKHWVTIPFIVRVDRSDVRIGEEETMLELNWFTIDKLPQPLHPSVQKQLDTYYSHFLKYRTSII